MAALRSSEVWRESRALRADAARLRREAREHVQACLLASARASSVSAEPRRSPWSDLEWVPVAAAGLDQVLVLL